MLKLHNIIKEYKMPSQTIRAVAGVSLEFRRSEFVSILGASGSGKTTMLNIIGGLDQYDEGDLVIESVSTKEYKDKDWDNYRNKRVGFVFQSYNLIPHLTLLGNVELALTISGISQKERKERAKQALLEVGLEAHINKKPNQLSGGQMQRVAIARALVNRPEILLADEPTGALDTSTSEQIMQLIKRIAKDKLVIMVTHNPELAKEYSSRIVCMKDGIVIEDSDPFDSEIEADREDDKNEKIDEVEEGEYQAKIQEGETDDNSDNNRSGIRSNKTKKKSSMSFVTALKISAKNLLTKKKRSAMTAVASAIGILGIGLILALSTGLNTFISDMTKNQVETSPIQILTSTVSQANGAAAQSLENFPIDPYVFIDRTLEPQQRTRVPAYIGYMLQGQGGAFDFDGQRAQLDSSWYNYVLYRTGMDINFFNQRQDGNFDMLTVGGMGGLMGMMMGAGGVQQLLCFDFTLRYYDVLAGRMPTAHNELVLIINEQNALTDITLMGLGLLNFGEDRTEFSFEDILAMEFMLPTNDALYRAVETDGQVIRFESNTIVSPGRTSLLAGDVIGNSDIESFSISGILRLKDGHDMGLYSSGIAYTRAAADWLQVQNAQSQIVRWMIDNPNYDPFTGNAFSMMSQQGMGGTVVLSAYDQWEDVFRRLGGVPVYGIAVNGMNLGANEVAIYATSLSAKDNINAVLDRYNEGRYEVDRIFYIDIIELLGAMMSSMVNMISWVLIAFTAISLVVSAVMISIITSISVLERTKEIGILRSIGARKKDVNRLFNAENVILGLIAGTLGVLVTLGLSFPLNLILGSLGGVSGIASLTWWHGAILLATSVTVAFVSGFLPARKAAKKDPVLALRSE